MAVQTSTSELLLRLSKRADIETVHEQAKQAPADFGNPQMPAGVEGGVAKLTMVKIGEYETGTHKGQLYFMAQGRALSPDTLPNGAKVKGQITKIGPEPLCDTPNATGKRKTFKDHYLWMLNQIKILGVNMEGVKFKDLPRIFALLNDKNRKTYFHFRTWAGAKQELKQRQDGSYGIYSNGRMLKGPFATEEEAKKENPYVGKEPMVNHEWNGACEYNEDGEAYLSAEVADSGNGSVNGTAHQDTPSSTPEKIEYTPDTSEDDIPFDDGAEETTTVTQEEAPNNQTFSEFEDILSLASAADSGDTEAAKTLQKQAISMGIDAKWISDIANNWREVADKMMQGQKKEEKPTKAPQKQPAASASQKEKPKPPYTPVVGQTCKFRVKAGAKPSDCEIVAVNPQAKTANLKDLSSNLAYKGVKWADIIPD